NSSRSCFIAEDGDTPVGFITSHKTDHTPPEWFIWQVGILPEYRGQGLVEELQDRVVEVAREAGAVAIRTTIEPDNFRSFGAFCRMAQRLNSKMEYLRSFKAAGSEVPEVLYRIPLDS
ncbi:MAG TPA: GNAT family N-acetyltransferase, partial [Candidatus Binatia bacterium]|nr:GNAT family N-acetyltransferase [Candidatus Binatia bacterium]